MGNSVVPLIIVFIAISSFNIYIGHITKKNKMTDMIPNYDSTKDNPEVMCKVVGNSFIMMGLFTILLSILYYFMKDIMSVELYCFLFTIIIFILFMNILFRRNKYRKEESNERET